jgi:DNA-binding transcriptional regulator WhiA
VDERQAITVRRVFQLKEEHSAWSLTQIAEAMNEEGFTTQQGSLFSKVQIKRIFYYGITVPRRMKGLMRRF